MKKMQLTFLFVIVAKLILAQTPQSISEADLLKIKQEVQKESEQLKAALLKKDYQSDDEKQLIVAFQLDTFVIEKLQSKKMELDYSTLGMVNAMNDTESEYDKLLNKYYQLLVKKLNDTDKEVLKQSQRNWIQYRDSERKLNSQLANEEYTGGGTMQRVVVASRYADITKQRVEELYLYLLRCSAL